MRWCRIGLVVLTLLAAAPPARAQTGDDNQRALVLGHDGLAAYNKGDWADARAKFAEADGLAHSPVFVLYLARSARNAGDLAAAKDAYDRLVIEAIPASAPAPWAAAVASARQERAELEKRLGEATPPGPTTTATAVSGAPTTPPAGPTASATAVPMPPTTGAPTTSALPSPVGSIAPASTGASPLSTAPVPSSGPDAGAQRGSIVPGVTALGLGVVGLGVGLGLFVHAKSMADGVIERCAGKALCPGEDAAVRDSAVGAADGATAAFVASGALLAAGVVLLVVRPGGSAAPAGARAGARSGPSVAVSPGWASIRVSGSF